MKKYFKIVVCLVVIGMILPVSVSAKTKTKTVGIGTTTVSLKNKELKRVDVELPKKGNYDIRVYNLVDKNEETEGNSYYNYDEKYDRLVKIKKTGLGKDCTMNLCNLHYWVDNTYKKAGYENIFKYWEDLSMDKVSYTKLKNVNMHYVLHCKVKTGTKVHLDIKNDNKGQVKLDIKVKKVG